MEKYQVLVLTDHSNHSKENSLYSLISTMLKHQLTSKIDIASRVNKENKSFFNSNEKADLFVSQVSKDFKFTENGVHLSTNLKLASLKDYDLIWLRMPPPLSKTFLDFLGKTFKNQVVINNPNGIYQTGTKAFLENFQAFCPPLKICKTKADIIKFKNRFPIVLKPLREYGGKGIIRVDGNKVWAGKKILAFKDFIHQLDNGTLPMLGVKFLKNVTEGDKRVVVVNGQIMGASLRLPAKGSWLCNVSMGGSSNLAEVEAEERRIVEAINPILSKMGIVMYGLDTLVGDDGKRVLSEINTTSIGGLPQIAALKKLPLVEEAIDLIWSYFLKNKINESSNQ